MSSRLMPRQVWVRSLVPNEKNSAVSAISSAVRAPRGISIIVPTRYLIFCPVSFCTNSATRCTISTWLSSSFLKPTSGIMISGFTLMPAFCTLAAASKTARACISEISG